MTNIPKHPCANKCSEFKAEQCKHCLISTDFELSAEADYVVGDTVVFKDSDMHDSLMAVSQVDEHSVFLDGGEKFVLKHLLRHASTTELKAKRRLSKENRTTCMGDDSHLENNISPLCKSYSNDEQIHLSKALDAQKEVS